MGQKNNEAAIARPKRDRIAITVFKSDAMRTVLVALHKGAEMVEHISEALINIQVLKGKIVLTKEKEFIELGKGQILVLQEGISHKVLAKKKAFFLLTIATP
jgi:quercetin dioxygenase-like cupin family protein